MAPKESEEERVIRLENSADKELAEFNSVVDEMEALTQKLAELKERKKSLNPNKLRKIAEEARNNYTVKRRSELSLKEVETKGKGRKWFEGTAQGYKAMPHQTIGGNFMAEAKRTILGDEMGLGKTCTTMVSMDLAGVKKAVIITPAEVTTNFLDEVKMWSDRPVINIRGFDSVEREVTLDMANKLEEYVIVMNYEIWRKDSSVLEAIANLNVDAVYLDEAHTIKGHTSLSYRGVRELVFAPNICRKCEQPIPVKIKETRSLSNQKIEALYSSGATVEQVNEFIESGGKLIDYKISRAHRCYNCGWDGEALDKPYDFFDSRSVKIYCSITGTPILNKPEDLWTHLHLLDPNQFETIGDFRDRFCVQDYNGNWEFGNGGLSMIKTALSGRYIARTTEDVNIVLPPRHNKVEYVNITDEDYPEQREIMRQLAKYSQIIIDDQEITMTAVIALITRQRQSVCYPGGIQLKDADGNVVWSVGETVKDAAKLDKAVDLIKADIAAGRRTVVFSQFTQALIELENRLKDEGIRAVTFAGHTPTNVRNRIKTNFDRKRGEEKVWDVVLCQYKSGGVGLNLTAATSMIILDREWNPGKENQAFKRIHRIGQTEPVTITEIKAQGTIDDWLEDLIQSKANLVEGFTESSREIQADLFDTLREALSKTA